MNLLHLKRINILRPKQNKRLKLPEIPLTTPDTEANIGEGATGGYDPTNMVSVYELNFDGNYLKRWQRVKEYWKLLQE